MTKEEERRIIHDKIVTKFANVVNEELPLQIQTVKSINDAFITWMDAKNFVSNYGVANWIKQGRVSMLIPEPPIHVIINEEAIVQEKNVIEFIKEMFKEKLEKLNENEETTSIFVTPTYKKTLTLYRIILNKLEPEDYYYIEKEGSMKPETLNEINAELFKLAKQKNVFFSVDEAYDDDQECNYIKLKIRSSKMIKDSFGITLEKGYELERNATDIRQKEYIMLLNEFIRQYIIYYEKDMMNNFNGDSIKNDAFNSLIALNYKFKDILNQGEILNELEFSLDNENQMLTIGKQNKIIKINIK